MAWTTPITATANSTFTANQWNAGVRDNLAMTAPGIVTTNGWLIVSTTAANVIAEREVAQAINDTSGTTTSTSFTATLTSGGTSPAVTVDTGTGALTWVSASLDNSATGSSQCGVDVTGATTSVVNANRCIIKDGGTNCTDRMGVSQALLAINAGSNTFQIQYATTTDTARFANRRIQVMAL
jgi:hypothetical protein